MMESSNVLVLGEVYAKILNEELDKAMEVFNVKKLLSKNRKN
jgi:hypothetical protein